MELLYDFPYEMTEKPTYRHGHYLLKDKRLLAPKPH